MRNFTIWYTADSRALMTHWSGESREEVINEFWEWALSEYHVVGVDYVELMGGEK